MKLVYWDLRGLAEPIRLLLKYAAIPYEEERLQFDTGSSDVKETFRKTKSSLGVPFPNLPFFVDNQVKLTQSQAIIKYIARIAGLRASPNDNAALAVEDMIENQIIDIRTKLIMPLFRPYPSEAEWQKEAAAIKEQFVEYFTQLDNFLASDGRKWLTGDRLSYVDFLAYEYLDWYRILLNEETVYDEGVTKYSNLGQYIARFEQLEPLKEYLASDAYRNAYLISPNGRIRSRRDR